MSPFDTVIRGGTVVTASDTFEADVGISDGTIQAIARNLPDGRQTIDARGRLVLPGGVDGHCHLDQPTGDGSVCADDFYTGTVAAAFGGTTTVIPFACQFRGMPMQAAVDDYHRRAQGKARRNHALPAVAAKAGEARGQVGKGGKGGRCRSQRRHRLRQMVGRLG